MQPFLSVICSNVYTGFAPLEFLLRNMAAQTYKDFELVIVDAYYEENAAYVKELSQELGLLRTIHTPACEARHVGRWMHWELLSNALLLSSGQWILQHGVHRYMHRGAVQCVVERAEQGICVVLYQGKGFAIMPCSFDDIEGPFEMDTHLEPLSYLTQSGFFSIRRDILINELNGHNEALLLHHWVDSDLSERARHLASLKVELMPKGLLRMEKPSWVIHRHSPAINDWDISKTSFTARGRQTCRITENPRCVVWLLRSLGAHRRIDGPVQRITHNGFEWVWCPDCGAVGIEDPDAYISNLSNSAFILSPINVCGIGRNIFTLDRDLHGLDLTDKVRLISDSHDNPKYLQ